MYALIDCNNFYANCEKLFQPWLKNTPIVVLSNNDGCVIARSNESKRLGIKMGEPAFKINDLIKKHNIKVFSSNYTLYGDISTRVINTIISFGQNYEIYSIDEVFMSFSDLKYYNIIDYAICIRQTILENIGIPVSIGIGPTKTLAKAANFFAKKIPQTKGIFQLIDNKNLKHSSKQGLRLKYLKKLLVGDIWGIGRQYSKFLIKNNIYNALEFTLKNDSWVKKRMSILGLKTKQELMGFSCISLETQSGSKKSIATTRSFGEMISDNNNLEQAISNFASKCAFKLRKQNSRCNSVIIFIVTNRHRKDLKQYYNSIVLKCTPATNSTIDIVKYALKGLKSIFKKGYFYKKAGVIATDIISDNIIQNDLFTCADYIKKHDKLMYYLDLSNFKIGSDKIKLASCGFDRKWKLKCEQKSKSYTTKWSEIIEIV